MHTTVSKALSPPTRSRASDGEKDAADDMPTAATTEPKTATAESKTRE